MSRYKRYKVEFFSCREISQFGEVTLVNKECKLVDLVDAQSLDKAYSMAEDIAFKMNKATNGKIAWKIASIENIDSQATSGNCEFMTPLPTHGKRTLLVEDNDLMQD